MLKTWQLRPEHTDIRLAAKDLVALFVSITSHWYEDPKNTLYGKKEYTYNMLVQWLGTGTEPENISHEMIYVLNKFRQEWFEPDTNNGMFMEAK